MSNTELFFDLVGQLTQIFALEIIALVKLDQIKDMEENIISIFFPQGGSLYLG